jgi:hypothetical protein
MNLGTTRTAVGSLLALWVGWLLLAIALAHQPFIVSPQPVHLTRQVMSMFTG